MGITKERTSNGSKRPPNSPVTVSEILNDLGMAVRSTQDSPFAPRGEEPVSPVENPFNPFERPGEDPPTRRHGRPDYSLELEVSANVTYRNLRNTLRALAEVPISAQSLQTVETFARLSREMLELLGKK